MNIFTNCYRTDEGWSDAQPTLVHHKCDFACQWLGNVDMHMYAKFDQHIPCVFKSYEHFH